MTDFKSKLKSCADLVEKHITKVFAEDHEGIEIERPKILIDAIKYGSLNGGKRLRPFLVMETASLFGVSRETSIQTATALECIHCYSLIHDDLPAMDDDDLRRGQPTTHIAFDEATAILAGDALLTFAFDLLSREETHPDPSIRIELVRLFSGTAGLGGMVGGQVLDLQAEGQTLGEQEILTLQAMKTGALIRCACEAGAILGGADRIERDALVSFGLLIGQAFQLADDILDVTSDAETMGKQTAKDASKGKGTLVDLYGVEPARQRAEALLDQAIDTLQPFGARADILVEAARFTVNRKH